MAMIQDQMQEAIHRSRLICDIVEEELSIRWGPKPVKEMTDEEVLLQAVLICNVFMQEEYDEQVSMGAHSSSSATHNNDLN